MVEKMKKATKFPQVKAYKNPPKGVKPNSHGEFPVGAVSTILKFWLSRFMDLESRSDYRQHVIGGLFDKFCSLVYPQHVGISVVIRA